MVRLQICTKAHAEMVDITAEVQRVVRQSGVQQGVCHVFVPHTTAGLTLNENCDPAVEEDILMVLDKLVPWRGGYRHAEGNSAAHVKASLLGDSVTVFIENGALALGTWQGLYLAEFDGPRQRRVWVKVASD
jgi:secondary thiamine-phosphate synthase enzyme